MAKSLASMLWRTARGPGPNQIGVPIWSLGGDKYRASRETRVRLRKRLRNLQKKCVFHYLSIQTILNLKIIGTFTDKN